MMDFLTSNFASRGNKPGATTNFPGNLKLEVYTSNVPVWDQGRNTMFNWTKKNINEDLETMVLKMNQVWQDKTDKELKVTNTRYEVAIQTKSSTN